MILVSSIMLLVTNANLCGLVSSVIPGKSYPANWPWIKITGHGEIGVLVNFGNNVLSSPASNAVSSHPIPNTVSGYGEVSLYNTDNHTESICLDKVDVSLYSNSSSTRCAVITLSEDRSSTNTQDITITVPENDENCMEQIVSSFYDTQTKIVAQRYAKRHVCLNRNIKRNGFTPIFCQSWTSNIGYQWNLVAYVGPAASFGNRIKNDLTAAWLTDALSVSVGSTSSIPFDDLATVCCENITLHNNLLSDGLYTRNFESCNRNQLDKLVNKFKDHIGHSYGFSTNQQVMEHTDGRWSIFVVELNFFNYFLVLPKSCDDDINLQEEGTIRSNDHFVDSACIETTSKTGFDYFTQGNWTMGMSLDVTCGAVDTKLKSTQSVVSTLSSNTTVEDSITPAIKTSQADTTTKAETTDDSPSSFACSCTAAIVLLYASGL